MPATLDRSENQPGAQPSGPDRDGDVRAMARDVVESARRAQTAWAMTPVRERLKRIAAARRLIASRSAEFARCASRLLSPAESLAVEVLPLVEACRFVERRAERLLAPRREARRGRPLWLTGVDLEIRREPLGVVLAIGPANYPLFLAGSQVVQGLAAGNAVIVKPGVGGTDASVALRDVLVEAGVDPALVPVLPEDPAAARAVIEEGVARVFLTGSAPTGEAVLATCAPRLIPVTTELSGNDAVFVMRGADLDLVTEALIFGSRLNVGSTCISPHRVFVPRDLRPALEKRLAGRARRVGAEWDRHGAASRIQKNVAGLVDEAVRGGARLVAGDAASNDPSVPIVLADVEASMDVVREDVPFPLVALIDVDDEDAALRANALCPYALGASVFGEETAARRFAQRVEAGVVTVNDVVAPVGDPRMPFGGRKRSGFGVTRGAEGLLEMTALKAISVRRRFWFHLDEEDPLDSELFSDYLIAAHGRGLAVRLRAAAALLRGLVRRGSRKKNSDSTRRKES